MYVNEGERYTGEPDVLTNIKGNDIFNSKFLYDLDSKMSYNKIVNSGEGRFDLVVKDSVENYGINYIYNKIKDNSEVKLGSKFYILSSLEISFIKAKLLIGS